MDWDGLRIFLAVARHGQLLGAARRLGLNHATVGRRLDSMERSLGAPLFDRRPTGCALTEAGEALLPTAERIETEIMEITEGIRGQDASVAGTVRIGVPDGLGNYFLAVEMARLSQSHPNMTIELVPIPRTFSLSRREADLAISLDRPTEGRLIAKRLTEYTLGVYAARQYLDTRGIPHSLDDLGEHVAVTGVEDLAYASALDYASVLDGRAGRTFRCASVVGQVEAVRAGTGIGILHDFAVGGFGDLRRILPQITFRRSYHLLSHPDTHGLRRIKACSDFMVRRFREERSRFVPAD